MISSLRDANFHLLLVFTILLFSNNTESSPAHPEVEFTQTPLSQFEQMKFEDSLGDSYDPITGLISFSVVDVSLPGNSTLKVELRRVLAMGHNDKIGRGEFGLWGIDVPYIMGYYTDGAYSRQASGGWHNGKVCTGTFQEIYITGQENSYHLNPKSYWDGKLLHIPGKVTEKFLNNENLKQLLVNGQITKSNYGITQCTNSSNSDDEGIIVKGPDGTSYTFNHSVDRRKFPIGGAVDTEIIFIKRIFLTQAKDKFGNTVDYKYTTINGVSRLSSIEGSDGRNIQFVYKNDGNNWIDEVMVNGRVWKYEYFSGVGFLEGRLKQVILPDNSSWQYSYELYNLIPGRKISNPTSYNGVQYKAGACLALDPVSQKSFYIKTPNGLQIDYVTQDKYFGRTNVDPNVQPFKTYQQDFERFSNVNCEVHNALIKKTISGKSIPSQIWNYSYSENTGKYSENGVNSHGARANSRHGGFDISYNGILPETVENKTDVSTTVISGPDVSKMYFINRDYKSNKFGKIVAIDTIAPNGEILERQENSYFVGSKIGDAWYREPMNCSGSCFDLIQYQSTEIDEYRIELNKIVYKREGEQFVTELSNYDNFGFPRNTKEYSTSTEEIRYSRKSYLHETTYWLLGLPRRTEISSDGVNYTLYDEIVYHDFSNTGLYQSLKLPYEVKRFGEWLTRYSLYHDDGMVKKVEFNEYLNNSSSALRYVEYDNYHRGQPQIIRLPHRYSSGCSGCVTTATKIINDDGAVAEIKDFNGNRTAYEYDELLRLKAIIPFDTKWVRTDFNYEFNDNYFVQNVQRGDYRSEVRYDGLLRPILIQEWDSSNAEATRRLTAKEYNSLNRVKFISYPSSSISGLEGTVFDYDALQRVKRQYSTVDNEGVEYEYLTNNQVRSTDARGNSTIVTYRSLGTPSQDFPSKIEQPHSVITEIFYNEFDNMTAIVQGGITETRIYDAQQRLCRLIRPDVGHTVYDYSKLGQQLWVAQGVSGSTTSCNRDFVFSSQKVLYSYDNIGALRLIDYPDNTPDKVYEYDNQGNLTALSAGNVIWSYSYNTSNLLESETLNIDNLSISTRTIYNSIGNINSMVYPSGKILDYSPNALGQPTRAGLYATGATYHPNGQVNGYTYGNGLIYNQTLDLKQRPEYQTVKRFSDNVIGHFYQYDSKNNVESINDLAIPSNSVHLTYDNLDRIKTAAGFWGAASFDYDVNGNIKNKRIGNETLIYSYNANNLLENVTGSFDRSFSYDSRGNVVSNGQRIFDFNIANQLVTSGSNSYQYDGYNRRVKKITNNSTQYSFYNFFGQLIITSGESGQTEYFYLGSKLVARESDSSASDDKPGFTGHVEDNDLQLTYMQQRYYDPIIGRFYSNDPVGFKARNPMMFNRYAYANNNPYKFVDPDGMYARGSGWKDEDWNKFDAAQKQTASDMSKTATSLRNEATGLKEGQTNANGYSASELNSMAGRLEQAATALNDNGSKGYFANAVSSFDKPHQYGDAVFGGKIITMSTEHYSFQDSNPARLQWNIGHEALHNAGMAHPIFQGSTPYRYGDFFQRKSFENLPANLRSTNPDYVLKQVYP